MKIAFQGESGAFSEEAVLTLYPEAECLPCGSFDAVFEAVHSARAERGVIPIENSLFGSVHQNYDLLRDHGLHIVAELHLRIRHHLLATENTRLEDIRSVCSHPQAIGQCSRFLKSHLPHARVEAVYDTAGAARMVADDGDPARTAIASRRAGVRYGLVTVAEEIENNHRNYTRFLSLASGADVRPESDVAEGRDQKTSIVYAQKENVPGSLFKSLAVFALRDIDLFKIESRPLVGSPGQYLFYLDLAGACEDEPVQNALRHLEEVAETVTVLGTYPVGERID